MLTFTLTRTAEYALRAMTALALQPKSDPINARDLSERTSVPVHYLNKIMRRLVEAGFVTSSKGHGGGFRLAKPATRIAYFDILKAVGYDSETKACVFGWNACRSDRPCPMHETWSHLNDQFLDWAGANTLASLRKSE